MTGRVRHTRKGAAVSLEAMVETYGETAVAAVGGLLIGIMFGAFAQRSRFCLRSAAIEFTRTTFESKLAVWLFVFAGAVVGTQLLIELGALKVSEARQLAGQASISGAILGGLMFGTGMILSRGCSSRLLVLSAQGNLRALLSGLVFAVTAQAALRGVLSPVRNSLATIWTAPASSLDILSLLGLGRGSGLLLGLVWLAAAIGFGIKSRMPLWGWVGGLGVGLAIALGWLFTYSLGLVAFNPVTVKSMNFSGPSADTLMLFLSPPGTPWSFDNGLIPGVFLGSFIAATLSRELKLEGFQGGEAMRRYLTGAVLMGFGAMLAGGCAVGSVTGASVFALTSWLTLFSIWVGAGIADRVIDGGGVAEPVSATTPSAVAASATQLR